MLDDPPLPDGAERTVLRGDATAEIPRLMAGARDLVDNLTAHDRSATSALAGTLANVQTTTETLNGPRGALGVLLGDERTPQEDRRGAGPRQRAAGALIDAPMAGAEGRRAGRQGRCPGLRRRRG